MADLSWGTCTVLLGRFGVQLGVPVLLTWTPTHRSVPPGWSYEHDMELGRFLYDHSERKLLCEDCIKDHLISIEVSSQVVSSGDPPWLKISMRHLSIIAAAVRSSQQWLSEGQGTVMTFHCSSTGLGLPLSGATIYLQPSEPRDWPSPDLLWCHGTHPGGGHDVPKVAQLPPSTHCTFAGGIQCSPSD